MLARKAPVCVRADRDLELVVFEQETDDGGAAYVLDRESYSADHRKALQVLFANPAQADAWIKRPNQAPLFGGRSALDRMLGGQVADLFVVRQYLDAQRG